MKLITQNLNYEELTGNLKFICSGTGGNIRFEEWGKKENNDVRLMIIFKPGTRESFAAIDYNQYKNSRGPLINRIKNGLMQSDPPTDEEKNHITGIANQLTKHGFAEVTTNKLNWFLQLLDENFGLRVIVKRTGEGRFMFERK